MKVQCSCGAKFVFEATPEMAREPVHFNCPSCGADISEPLNALIRQQFGVTNVPEPVAAGASQAAGSSEQGAPLRVKREPARPIRVDLPKQEEEGEGQICVRHPEYYITEKCYVCQKPICPKCMDLFGYLCSPLCKARANSHGITVPVFEGQRHLVEARTWRKTVRVASVAAALIVLLLGVWTWYVWFGQSPRSIFSIRFAQPALSGQTAAGPNHQLIFIHGDTLARYDMKTKNQIWSRNLIDKNQIDAGVQKEIREIQRWIDEANSAGRERVPKMPSRDKLTLEAEREAEAGLELRVKGQNIWVISPGKLVRYDWDSGNPVKEISVKTRYGALMALGDELLLLDTSSGKPLATHINLATAETRNEEVGAVTNLTFAGGDSSTDGPPGSKGLAGLPVGKPGKDSDKAMDPQKVAQKAQSMSYPARVALPAVLSNARVQERALDEMDDSDSKPAPGAPGKPRRNNNESVSVIPTQEGFLEFSVGLIESKMVARNAMKAAAGKSVLNGDLTLSGTADASNEILNEMQRERGGGVVYEDQSRYRVTIRRTDGKGEWSGEVISYPKFYPLRTVNVLAADKSIIVFDKSNRKLWQSALGYNIHSGMAGIDEANAPYGLGPVAEKGNSLYVYDEAVLTAFDLQKGTVRWRLPSVGISGLFFDDQGMVYVNTSTASPESIRYSRQIDIRSQVASVVTKIDPKTGKTLWTIEPRGLINYVSGKFIFIVQSYMPEEPDPDDPYHVDSGFEKPPFFRITRINPKNGREMWEHFQQRAPVDVQFDKNTIRLVFKKEVQVLKFLSL